MQVCPYLWTFSFPVSIKTDIICSLGVEIDLRLEDLPEERWNRNTISTLGCVKPSDTRIHKELLRILQDNSPDIYYLQLYVSWALIKQNSLNSDIISALITILLDKSVDIELRKSVSLALGKQSSLNSDIISALITILLDKSVDIELRKSVSLALGKQSSLNSDMISALIRYFKDPLLISQAMVTLNELNQVTSSNPEVAKHILKAISEEASLDEKIRRKATQTLQEINNRYKPSHSFN